ncbi:caspase recruitment domain family member 17 [Phyllostomus discolor]|nr:caspase recruitment domain family member 17 [Phyllostomus discolor]
MEKVRRENYTAMDKARDLIDSVIRKGHQASQIFINQIVEVDPQLAHNLGLS